MTQARELSCLRVRLEEAGDQQGESLTSGVAPSPCLPLSKGTLYYLPSALRQEQGLGWRGGESILGLFPLVLRGAVVRASSPSLGLARCPSWCEEGSAPRSLRQDEGLWVGILFPASLLWLLFPGSKGKVHLVVPGSCEGPQEATVGAGSLHFHCPACWEPELSVRLQVVCLLLL